MSVHFLLSHAGLPCLIAYILLSVALSSKSHVSRMRMRAGGVTCTSDRFVSHHVVVTLFWFEYNV